MNLNLLKRITVTEMLFYIPHNYLHWLSFALCFALINSPLSTQAQQQQHNVNIQTQPQPHYQLSEKPNIVIILIDDMVSNALNSFLSKDKNHKITVKIKVCEMNWNCEGTTLQK